MSGPVYLAASGFSTVYLEKESAGLYTLERGGGEEMYVCSAVLNLYNTNTPFADDQWVLLGAVPGRTLFALKHDTLLIMLALLASIVLTSLVTILITVRSVSQPIVKLAAEVRATDPAAPARLQKTDITELDALAGSIETLSDEVLRAGGKFTQILEMASVRMGGFEVDGRDGTLFLTDQFFDVFGRSELASIRNTFSACRSRTACAGCVCACCAAVPAGRAWPRTSPVTGCRWNAWNTSVTTTCSPSFITAAHSNVWRWRCWPEGRRRRAWVRW